ncbi:winged helix-turn-helix domain-containing protein [Salinimonas chungwhensis]|uniref:winged helix-turn-helix domain-containing protein n=1 Tax=Salinimonas chungwhensis TaxID=265425 RepID=UPI00036C792D|nr:helix-turn-helix domain-containing protein [Salinimonas chungwhensis]
MSMHPVFPNYDSATRTVCNSQGDRRVLSPQCALLLELFLTQDNHFVSRQQIRQHIWQHNIVSDDMINHLVCRLRKELKSVSVDCDWRIEAIPKRGYQMVINNMKHDFTYWLHRCSNWFSGNV